MKCSRKIQLITACAKPAATNRHQLRCQTPISDPATNPALFLLTRRIVWVVSLVMTFLSLPPVFSFDGSANSTSAIRMPSGPLGQCWKTATWRLILARFRTAGMGKLRRCPGGFSILTKIASMFGRHAHCFNSEPLKSRNCRRPFRGL